MSGQKNALRYQQQRGGEIKKELFSELLKSMQEMDQVIQGDLASGQVFQFTGPEVKQIRKKTGLNQAQFAKLIFISRRTLENWEQGRTKPSGPSKALLRILYADPEHALRALRGYAEDTAQ